MTAISSDGIDPFDVLDVDWSALCRQHRRSGAVARWAEHEPALAGFQRLEDVIPPLSVDRGPICAALAQLQRAGDDLAGRALLQLCIPGLMYLAARWRPLLPGSNTAAWEVVTRTGIYIARLRDNEIHCNVRVAGYLVRSVHRDLVRDAQQEVHRGYELDPERNEDGTNVRYLDGPRVASSAEDIVCAAHDVRSTLGTAARVGVVPLDVARTLWLLLSGYSMEDASRFADRSVAAIYRHRGRVYARLYEQLFAEAG